MRASAGTRRRALVAATWLVPPLVIVALWWQVIAFYHVPAPRVAAETVAALRTVPADAVLAELDAYRLSDSGRLSPAQKLAMARSVLEGRLELPPWPAVELGLPFAPADLEQGPSTLQVKTAGMIVVELLLDAYRQTGEARFFDAARERVLAWAAFHRRRVRPLGLLWNDHAIASRSVVLASFWRVYRAHQDYDPAAARTVLAAVARDAAYLADPEHFTFFSNHGVMQNLALLHLAVAFPALDELHGYRAVALRRLAEQMEFYVTREGAVLEHSATYQEFGVTLLGKALRYATLLGEPLPDDWVLRYRQAVDFYAMLRRPDATLPLLGDSERAAYPRVGVTRIDEEGAAPPRVAGEWRPTETRWLDPVTGYAVWWQGLDRPPHRRSQTVMAWSHFASGAHKHADELGVTFWAGRPWWDGVGYWPREHPGLIEALGWAGSNAPHPPGGAGAGRRSTLRASGGVAQAALVDVERRHDDGYVARRQLVHCGELHAVIDRGADARGRPLRQVWTLPPDVRLEEAGAGRYEARAAGARLSIGVHGNGTAAIWRGSSDPFAGWMVIGGRVHEAPALVLETAAGQWTVVAWLAGGRLTERPALEATSESVWRLRSSTTAGPFRLSRDGDTVRCTPPAGPEHVVPLYPAPAEADARAAAYVTAFEDLARRYPLHRDLFFYRSRASALLLAAFVIQQAVFLAVRRLRRPPVLLAMLAVWAGVGYWAVTQYLV